MRSFLGGMLFLALGLTAGAIAPGLAGGATVDRVVARINGEIVTEHDLHLAMKERGQSSLTSEFVANFLDQKLLLQEAARQQIQAPDDMLEREVEEMVRDIRGKYPDEKTFRQALLDEGLSLQDFKDKLLKRARTDHQIFQMVTAGAPLSDQDSVDFEKPAEGADAPSASYRLRRLAVPVGKGGANAACEKVRQLTQKISTDGLSFEDGIRRYSGVPGAKEDGGDLGWMDLSQLSAQVAAAVKDLKPGQASAPVVTGGFASVFYVEGKRGGKANQLESRFSQRKDALIKRLRERASVEVYSEKLQRLLPKEFAAVNRAARATVTPAAASAADAAPTLAPAPSPSPTPRKGLLRLFRRDK